MGMAARKRFPLTRGFFGTLVVALLAIVLTAKTPDGARGHTGERKTILAGSTEPALVREVLQRACQDCHSANTTWPWYANLPPISWQIHQDVTAGRAFMDLSKWEDYTEGERRGFRLAIGAAIENHMMP